MNASTAVLGCASVLALAAPPEPPIARLPRTHRVDFTDAPIGNDVLELLAGMSELTELVLNGTSIDDAGIAKLAPLKKIQFLLLDRTAVTDAGLKYLTERRDLTVVNVSETKITDAGLKTLALVPHLGSLSLRGCKEITGKGLEAFEGRYFFRGLTLNDTPLGGGEAVPSIRKLSNLTAIHLDRTRLTDQGLAALVKPGALRQVRTLRINGTAMSDAGLKALHDRQSLPSCRSIYICDTMVTPEGAEALRKARRGLEVIEE